MALVEACPTRVAHWAAARMAALVVLAAAPCGALAQFDGNHTLDRHRLNEENFFDWKAYQPLQPWRYESATAPNELRATVGSLSQTRFYQFQSLRLERDLNEWWTFQYRHEEESFLKDDPLYQEVEMRLGQGLYGSIVGMAQADKALGNAGFAVAVGERTGGSYLKLSHIEQYALYNEKADEGARYKPTPHLNRLEAQAITGPWFLQATVKREGPAILENGEDYQRQTYDGTKVRTVTDYWLSPRLAVGLKVGANLEWRERISESDSELSRQEQTLDWGWRDAYAVWHTPGGDVWELGVLYGYAYNTIDSTVAEEFYDFDFESRGAYAIWQWFRTERFQWLFSLQAGSMHLREFRGGEGVQVPDRFDEPQAKLGVGVVVAQQDSYRFLFNSTYDLDILTARAWDGGNLQLQVFF